MARGRKAIHICENCQKSIEVTRWEYFNSRQDEKRLPELRNYHLFNSFCPHCGGKIYPEICLLYQDMDNRVVIYYIDGANKEAKKQEILKTIAQDPIRGYSYRVVTNRVSFVQKVEMLLCGYDDRILEPAKWFTFMAALDTDLPMEPQNIWFELDEEENAVWHISYPDHNEQIMEITPEMYADYVSLFTDLIDVTEEEICANEDWAAEIIQELWAQYERETKQTE